MRKNFRMVFGCIVWALHVFVASSAICQQSPASDFAAPVSDTRPSLDSPKKYPSIPPLPEGYERNFKLTRNPELKGRIAFTAKAHGFQRIFVLDLESYQIHPIIDGPGNNRYPSWSPDGTKLVFNSDRDGSREIYISDWDGENQKRLTKNNVTDDDPSWSPDGKKVLYYSVSSKSGTKVITNLFTMRPDGTGKEQITHFRGKNTTPRWSPEGGSIAYSTNRFWPGWDVCIWNIKSKIEQCPLSGKDSYCRPMWSPSGSSLMYSYGSHRDIDLGRYYLGETGGQLLVRAPRRLYDGVWSPSEKFIVFAAEAHDAPDDFNAMILDIDNEKKSPLILSSRYSIRYFSWTETTTLELEAKRAARASTVSATPSVLIETPGGKEAADTTTPRTGGTSTEELEKEIF